MQKETLAEARERALGWKINALVLLFIILVGCINSYIGDQKVINKDLDYDLLLLENQKLLKDKSRADSLISKQSNYIQNCKELIKLVD